MTKSLIIYTNNSAKYIRTLLRSILKQYENGTGEFNELIIVDDMSTDETIPIIVNEIGAWFTEEETFKLYINSKPKGRIASIEMAKKLSTADYNLVVNKKKGGLKI